MGRDKALLTIDGVPMARRVANGLTAAGATTVVAVGGDAVAMATLGLDVIGDDAPGEGPLGGVLTALRWAGTRPCVVAPCDLVDPDPSTLAGLPAGLDAGIEIVVPEVDGEWWPLPAAFAPSARAPLADAFGRGERAVHRAIATCAFRAVPAGPLRDADAPGDLPTGR
jgi:molybdopterin-guanine dinucleotide biosynthesis protein A